MRQIWIPAALTLAVLPAFAAAPAAAPTPDAPKRYLKGSQCLDPSFARSFYTLDNRRLLVDAGSRKYLIEVASSCWNLDFANAVGFRGDLVSNRVCGSVHDAIIVRNEPPCRIERMELLSKEQYQQAIQERDAWRKAKREAAKKKQER